MKVPAAVRTFRGRFQGLDEEGRREGEHRYADAEARLRACAELYAFNYRFAESQARHLLGGDDAALVAATVSRHRRESAPLPAPLRERWNRLARRAR